MIPTPERNLRKVVILKIFVVGWLAHEILVTSKRPNSPFPFWSRVCQFDESLVLLRLHLIMEQAVFDYFLTLRLSFARPKVRQASLRLLSGFLSNGVISLQVWCMNEFELL